MIDFAFGAERTFAFHLLEVGEFETVDATYYSYCLGSWLYLLVVVYSLPAAPDLEIAYYVGQTPLAHFLAVGADYGGDVDQTYAVAHFHLFFAMLAPQSEF